MVRFTHNLTLYPRTSIDPALANGPGMRIISGDPVHTPCLNVLCPLIPGAKTGVCNHDQMRGSGPKSDLVSLACLRAEYTYAFEFL